MINTHMLLYIHFMMLLFHYLVLHSYMLLVTLTAIKSAALDK